MRTCTLIALLASLATLAAPVHAHAPGRHRNHGRNFKSPDAYRAESKALEKTMVKLYNHTRVGKSTNKQTGSRELDKEQKEELKELKLDQVKDRQLRKDRISAIIAANEAKSAKSTSSQASRKQPSTASTRSTRAFATAMASDTAAASTSTGLKKGLGYNTASFTNAFSTHIGWAYNWASAQDTSTGSLTKGVEFVPMLWGNDSTGWSDSAKVGIAAGATSLLGFNEPDCIPSVCVQADMSPAWAAERWVLEMEPWHGKAALISPAITNGGAPMESTWMSEFLSNCTSCHVSAVAAHWYDQATNVDYFKNYLTDLHNSTGKPIWLTEFAGSGTVAEQQTFLETVIPWMEKSAFIERYAAFGDFAGTFVDSTGALTPLGRTYMNTVG